MGSNDALPPDPLHSFPGLVCPACHAALVPEQSGIRCTGCGRLYPIRDGLPVLIRAEAYRPENGG